MTATLSALVAAAVLVTGCPPSADGGARERPLSSYEASDTCPYMSVNELLYHVSCSCGTGRRIDARYYGETFRVRLISRCGSIVDVWIRPTDGVITNPESCTSLACGGAAETDCSSPPSTERPSCFGPPSPGGGAAGNDGGGAPYDAGWTADTADGGVSGDPWGADGGDAYRGDPYGGDPYGSKDGGDTTRDDSYGDDPYASTDGGDGWSDEGW